MPFISGQNAEGSRQISGPNPPAGLRVPASPRPRVSFRRRGFTLIEMLIVMGIIILAVTLAIPAIKYLTGSKSEQAAQNTVAAAMATARADAIGLQQPMGVMFLIDAATDRVQVVEVSQTVLPGDPVPILDLTPDRDPLILPMGIRAWTIKDTYFPKPPQSASTIPDPFPGYRYLGFNPTAYSNGTITDKAMIGGVILFDGQGNLLVTQYGFRFSIAGTPTGLANAVFLNPSSSSPPPIWPASSTTAFLRSQLGMVFVDRDTFRSFAATLPTVPTNADSNTVGDEPQIDAWLDTNTTPVLINNYTGTLTRAE
jgi:prepilin-type N-terminal cleavage/methylation domain-containing protein